MKKCEEFEEVIIANGGTVREVWSGFEQENACEIMRWCQEGRKYLEKFSEKIRKVWSQENVVEKRERCGEDGIWSSDKEISQKELVLYLLSVI